MRVIVTDAELAHVDATLTWLGRARDALVWLRDHGQAEEPDGL